MTRYQASIIVFLAVTGIAVGCLLLSAADYTTSAFDCDLPGLYGPDCADEKARQAATQFMAKAPAIAVAWFLALAIVIRERKKH